MESKSFGLDKRGEVRRWLDAKQGEANCYFYINRLKLGATSLMASKSDIKFTMFCHVAIDSCDAVALARLQAFRPAPSLILRDSSGYTHPINGNVQMHLSFCCMHFSDIYMEVTDRVSFELLFGRLVTSNVRQARDTMAMQGGACQMWNVGWRE